MRRFQINSQKTAVSIFTEYDVVVLHPWLVSKRCCSLWKCPGCVFNCLQATIDNWFVMSLVFADFARWFHLFSHQFSVRRTFPLQERNSSRYSCTSDLFINNEFMRYGNWPLHSYHGSPEIRSINDFSSSHNHYSSCVAHTINSRLYSSFMHPPGKVQLRKQSSRINQDDFVWDSSLTVFAYNYNTNHNNCKETLAWKCSS